MLILRAGPAGSHGRPARSGRRAFGGRRIGGRSLLTAAAILAAWIGSASAQAISVAPSLTAEPATSVAFQIRVGLPAVPRGSFVRVRGLPPAASLSEGHSIAPGVWAVPMAALPDLKVVLPPVMAGRADIVVTLVGIDGSVLGETKSTLVIAAAPTSAPPAQGASLSPNPVLPERTMLTPEDRERAQRLIKRGNEHLADGAVAQARLLYERAADAGLALGAMAMAATYDAVELDRMRALGLKPDREAARRWYERARALGAAEAEARLQQLGAK